MLTVNCPLSRWIKFAQQSNLKLNIFSIQALFQKREHLTHSPEQSLRLLAQNTPFEYLTQRCDFGHLELIIKKPLLVPRECTYHWLCQSFKIIERHLNRPVDSFIELGIGSGALFLTALKRFENAHAVGVDINELALQVSKENLELLQKKQILKSPLKEHLFLSSWWEQVPEQKFDVIFSNPPYICPHETFWLEGTEQESDRALFSSHGGLHDLEQILKSAKLFSHEKTIMFLEHGAGAGPSVVALAQFYQWKKWHKLFDEQGFWRATCLY